MKFITCAYPDCKSLAAATLEINVGFVYTDAWTCGPCPTVCQLHYDLLRDDLDMLLDWCEDPLPLLDEEEDQDWGVGA